MNTMAVFLPFIRQHNLFKIDFYHNLLLNHYVVGYATKKHRTKPVLCEMIKYPKYSQKLLLRVIEILAAVYYLLGIIEMLAHFFNPL